MRPFVAIIPTLNEEELVGRAIHSARDAGISRVVVSDGGSRDRTIEVARIAGAEVIEGATCRGAQINRALERVPDDHVVIILHADTELPADAVPRIEEAMNGGTRFGGFRLSFHETSPALRVASALINLRSSCLREPWGDQAQWMLRGTAREAGDYRELPILEDYEFARRLRRLVPSRVLKERVRTSGRRFVSKGVLGTTFTNWLLVLRYHLGADPMRLARIYRGVDDAATRDPTSSP